MSADVYKRQILDLEAAQDSGSILDTMVSLINLTVIEEAPRTGELLNQLIDYVKYSSMEKGTFVSLSRELEQAERFLSMQKQKLGERLNFSIQVPKNMTMQRIPSDVLLPFVKSAVYYGVMMKKEGGEVTVKGCLSGGKCVIEVEAVSYTHLDVYKRQGDYIGEEEVAVDYVGAGIGETVLIGQGSSVRVDEKKRQAVIDMAIIGIVDNIDI